MKIEITDAWWLCEYLNVSFKFTFAPEDTVPMITGPMPEEIIEETCMLSHAEDIHKCFERNAPSAIPFRSLFRALHRRYLQDEGMAEYCIKLIHRHLQEKGHAGTVRFPSR